jgi:long-subunit fatty acid transport protein
MARMLSLRGTGAALCWSTGLQYELTDATTLGVTYPSESRFALHGPTNVDVSLLG